MTQWSKWTTDPVPVWAAMTEQDRKNLKTIKAKFGMTFERGRIKREADPENR